MQTQVELPQAFSVRDDHEIFPIQHLMARLNPNLMVVQVATGRHTSSGCTVFWGIVYLEGQTPTKQQVETALREAGFDFGHGFLIQAPQLLSQPA